MVKIIRVLVACLGLAVIVSISSPVRAQETPTNASMTTLMQEGKISRILEEKQIEVMGNKQLYQRLELHITKGTLAGKTITLESGNVPVVNLQHYNVGDKVMVAYTQDSEGHDMFYIADFIRRDALVQLLVIFVVITLIVAKWRGVNSLISLVISFGVIFYFILPQISAGVDPVLIAIAGSVFIIPVTFYLSHGFSKKTTVAIVGTLLSLIITSLLASLYIEVAKLSGFATEEASFLQTAKQGMISIKGLLLAGTIIGALGVLDDITVAQAGVVAQLRETAKDLPFREVYRRAMEVGQDHIASMVNTLVLVYTGASLPLLLLFINNPQPFSEVINYEMISNEIVRTLVGSIGLIAAVPITTALAGIYLHSAKEPAQSKKDSQSGRSRRYFTKMKA